MSDKDDVAFFLTSVWSSMLQLHSPDTKDRWTFGAPKNLKWFWLARRWRLTRQANHHVDGAWRNLAAANVWLKERELYFCDMLYFNSLHAFYDVIWERLQSKNIWILKSSF